MASASDLTLKTISWQPVGGERQYRVYVILGNQWGDEGKGKVMRMYLIGTGNRAKARYCIRFNGGPNAGHTIILDRSDPELFAGPGFQRNGPRIKFATHQLPSGILFGIPSIIGYNCVVDLVKLGKEIEEVAALLCRSVEEIQELLTICPQAHLITDELIAQDRANNAVGTTGSGIGPTYSAKALRTGHQIQSIFHWDKTKQAPGLTIPASMAPQVIETTAGVLMLGRIRVADITGLADTLGYADTVVMEGAQGFWLDANHGKYPYVTSSCCTAAAACEYGFLFRNIYPVGISKMYPTYVGALQMEPGFEQDVKHSGRLELLRLIAREYGVTTGRRRQVMWMIVDHEIKALKINQSHDWIINKSDVLPELQTALDMAHGGTLYLHADPAVAAYGQFLLANPAVIETLPRSAYNFYYKGELCTFGSLAAMKTRLYAIVHEANLAVQPRIVTYDTPESHVAFNTPFLV